MKFLHDILVEIESKSPKEILVSGVNIVPYLLELTQYLEKEGGLKLKPYPKVVIKKEAQHPITGKTAFYVPEANVVTLFVKDRLPKDILRSYAHEMIHRNQEVEGKLSSDHAENLSDPHYIKNDKHLRHLEAEAYLKGNLLFRDWTETLNT
jgi:hypothetical protein